MATTFYLLNEAAPYTPPSWRGSWDADGATSIAIDPNPFGGIASSAGTAEATATTPWKVGVLRGVSRRLAPQTISGTVNAVIGILESDADANFYTRLHIYVVNTASGAVLGTALNGYTESAAGGATEWPTTSTGAALLSAQTLTSVVVPNDGVDYRLVVELGYSSENSHTTSRTGTIRTGARGSTESLLADLTVGSTSTTTRAGFLTFSGTISLHSSTLTNLTPETATDIGFLPMSSSTNARDNGYTYKVWYKFTAPAQDVYGLFGFGDLVTYRPTLVVYAGPVASFDLQVTAQNKPVQWATVAGTTYYAKFTPNASTADPAVLLLDLQRAPNEPIPPGSIIVNDDTDGLPAAVISGTDGSVLKFLHGVVAGEQGDALANGTMLFDDNTNGQLQLLDPGLNIVKTIPFDHTGDAFIRTHIMANQFYVGHPDTEKVYTVSPAGDLSTTNWGPLAASFNAIAVNSTGAKIIYDAPSSAIKQWDTATNSALSDLVADVGGTYRVEDILVLQDDTLIVNYFQTADNHLLIKHYSAAGATLDTFDLGTAFNNTTPRIAYAHDDPDAFWLWTHSTDSVSTFTKMAASGGATLTSLSGVAEFENGAYQGPESADPPRFGVSFSCPFVVTRSPTTLPVVCCPCDCPPPTKNGSPVTEPHSGPVLPPVDPVDFTPECTGGGDVPTASDATDPESWVQ